MASAFRIHRSDEGRLTRQAQADVNRALEVLGTEADAAEARICGGVQSFRRRLPYLICESACCAGWASARVPRPPDQEARMGRGSIGGAGSGHRGGDG